MVDKYKEIAVKKADFLTYTNRKPGKQGQLTAYGLLCFFALIFDFFINSATLEWLPHMLQTRLPVQVFALIFSFFDAIIAALQAGAFAKTEIEIEEAKRKWRPVLWSLAFIKIVLYIVFTHIVREGQIEGSIITTIIQILFLVLIYIIFDKAGGGIYYIVQRAKIFILEDVWYDTPKKIEDNFNKIYHDVSAKCPRYGLEFSDFLSFFKLPKRINENTGIGDN